MNAKKPNNPSIDDLIILNHKELYLQFALIENLLEEILWDKTPHSVKLETLSFLLDFLCKQLKLHFDLEESSGGFQELVIETPILATRIKALFSDHNRMLEDLIQIVEGTQSLNLNLLDNIKIIQKDFHGFIEKIKKHEAQEMKVLTYSYYNDLGGEC